MSITNHQFRLTFPDEWKETTVYTFVGPFDSGVQHNLVLTIIEDIPEDVELKDWAKSLCDNSSYLLPGFEYVEEKEGLHPSGAKTYEIVYKYLPSDDTILFQKQWYVIINGKGYVFTATFSKKTLSTLVNDVAKIVESLEIEGEE